MASGGCTWWTISLVIWAIISEWALDFDLEPTILANISTRLRVETGDNVLIGGFIVTGTQPKNVIVRATRCIVAGGGSSAGSDPGVARRARRADLVQR